MRTAELLAELGGRQALVCTWGVVSSTSPVQVTFAGDTAATTVTLRDNAYTPAVSDKVWLLRVGTQWMIGGRIVAA